MVQDLNSHYLQEIVWRCFLATSLWRNILQTLEVLELGLKKQSYNSCLNYPEVGELAFYPASCQRKNGLSDHLTSQHCVPPFAQPTPPTAWWCMPWQWQSGFRQSASADHLWILDKLNSQDSMDCLFWRNLFKGWASSSSKAKMTMALGNFNKLWGSVLTIFGLLMQSWLPRRKGWVPRKSDSSKYKHFVIERPWKIMSNIACHCHEQYFACEPLGWQHVIKIHISFFEHHQGMQQGTTHRKNGYIWPVVLWSWSQLQGKDPKCWSCFCVSTWFLVH